MASIINATTTAGVSVQGDNSGSLQLATNNGTTAVTVTTAQLVGVGTTSPTGKLHVYGSGEVQTLQRNSVSVNNYTLFKTEAGADQAYLGFSDSGVNDFAIFNVQSGYIRFGTNNAERMRINSSGTTLIGNTSDTNLPGNGTSNANGLGIFSDGRLCIGRNSFTAQIGVNSSGSGITAVQFLQNGTSVGLISVSNNTSTAYGTSSDYRLKENIAPMTGALNIVQQLKPVTYKWKVDGYDGQGFIAHELQEVVPDCVIGEKDAVDKEGKPIHQSIDTSFLVATLTAAIQELKAELDATKAEVQALKGTL